MEERIRFGLPIEPSIPTEELPSDFLLIEHKSKIQKDSFQIYIVENIYNQIWEHVNSSLDAECGGVLIGHPFKSLDGTIVYVIVVAFIPQPSTKRGIAHFTVGPKEVAYTRDTLVQKYPGLVIVGWYHSHPGHGVFLSGQDMTIVRSIYNLDWHLAMVLDPVHKTYGFFYGANGTATSNLGFLSETPASVKAISLYNRLKSLKNEQDEEASLLRDGIFSLIEGDVDLNHWKETGKYQDLELTVASSIIPKKIKPSGDLPIPARKNKSPLNALQLIIYIYLPVLLASGFIFAGVFLFNFSRVIGSVLFGVILGLVVGYGIIFPLNSGDSKWIGKHYRLLYTVISMLCLVIFICYWGFISILIWKQGL